MSSVEVPFKVADGSVLPGYARKGDAGMDLRSSEDLVLAPFERKAVGTGLWMGLPDGFCAKVLPRSGMALNQGVTVVNAPGLIDSGYRGEVRVALMNMDPVNQVAIKKGDRIAQLVVERTVQVTPVQVDELDATERGEGGFGSTGVE